MRALVTGAGGFVGANLVRHLRDRGHEPFAVLRPGGTSWRLEDVPAHTEFVDLRRPDHVVAAVTDIRPDVIFNLAAYGAYSWQTDLGSMLDVNVRATEAMLEGARRVGARLVQAGSSSEYGFAERATNELDRLEPNSYYAVTKAAATHLCRLAAAQHDQHAVTLRLYSVYGPWEEPGRLLPALIERALGGTYPPLVAPDTARDFVWIDDVCDALVRGAAVDPCHRGAVVNIASGRQTTLRSLVAIVREAFGLADEPQWGTMQRRSWDASVWVGDPARAADVIGWHAVTTLSRGVAKLGEWLRDHPELRDRYAPPVSAAA
jgi:dolichol-phosphate mannosyltransferase